MTPLLRPDRLLVAAVLAAACTLAAGQPPVGPPTYVATAALGLVPGDRPPITAHVSVPTWKSAGSSTASGGFASGPFVNFAPSEARAIADDFNLKALAYVGGTVQFDPVQTPHLHATALARNTRYWQTGAADTPLDFTAFLDGVLAADLVFAELPVQVVSTVSFSLDVVNLAGQPIVQVFRNTAHIDWNGSAGRWQFRSGSTLPGTDWADAFTVTGTQQPRPTMRAELVYVDFLAGAYTAPAGSLFGLQWTLEAEALIEGIAVQGAMTADFLHTAGIGLAVAADAPPGAALTELLTVPLAVPEPGAAALMLAGLALLAHRAAGARR